MNIGTTHTIISAESMPLALLTLLLVCHWIGDFTHASRPWMLAAKSKGAPLLPTLAHAAVHAVLVGIVCAVVVSPVSGAIAFWIQLLWHFVIDVTKGRINVHFAAVKDPTKYPHWYLFGADQFAHQLVLIITVILII